MDYAREILNKKPIVQCITNIVTVNDCANALLAVGASPTMAHHIAEMEEIQSGCDALICNLGATENYDAMLIAAKQAAKSGHPVVIDPVGCGGSSFRREFFNELITVCKPSCIRGNYAEITALANNAGTVTGVDNRENAKNDSNTIREAASVLSKKTGSIVVASGEEDIVCFMDEITSISGGDELMGRITGSGCMESSLLGAYLSVEQSVNSVRSCLIRFKKAGMQAAFTTHERGGGTMTFKEKFIDRLYIH